MRRDGGEEEEREGGGSKSTTRKICPLLNFFNRLSNKARKESLSRINERFLNSLKKAVCKIHSQMRAND